MRVAWEGRREEREGGGGAEAEEGRGGIEEKRVRRGREGCRWRVDEDERISIKR